MLAIAKSENEGNASNEQLLIRFAKNSVRPAYEYFKQKFDYNNGLKDIILAFKAARVFSPPQMDELKPTPAEIDTLEKFPFLDSCLIHRLKEELPAYIAAVEDVSCDVDVAKWWKNH